MPVLDKWRYNDLQARSILSREWARRVIAKIWHKYSRVWKVIIIFWGKIGTMMFWGRIDKSRGIRLFSKDKFIGIKLLVF